MEAEEFMDLFDLCWFGFKDEIPSTAMLMFTKIEYKSLDKLKLRPSCRPCIDRLDMQAAAAERLMVAKLLKRIDESHDKLQLQSFSDGCIGSDMRSAASERSKSKLQKSSSRKEIVEKTVSKKQCSRRKKLRRSSSAMEIEEVKGFMDLFSRKRI